MSEINNRPVEKFIALQADNGFGDYLGSPDSGWRDSAECRGMDPDIFFPERGKPTKLARAICSACDVQLECLNFSIEINEDIGIWGAMSHKERQAEKRNRKAAANKEDDYAA